MKKLTIKTIAEKAGVSVATVSKVINNSGNISDRTKNRILSIIHEYHFVPQQRKQKGNSLGVIMTFAGRVSSQILSKKLSVTAAFSRRYAGKKSENFSFSI